MKILRYLAIAALLAAGNRIARADGVDFQFKVLDPPSSPYFALVQPGQPFEVTFAPCPFGIGDGCFLGFNDSHQFLTSLDVTFPDTASLGGQPVSCITVGTLFGDANCSLSGDVYVLDLYGGSGIAPYTFFLLVEDGVCASDFPEGDAIANSPEPSSIWLGLSGAGSLGYLVRRRRRKIFGV